MHAWASWAVWVRSVDTGTTVIKTNDSGRGTLREAITFANANPGEDAIRFNIPGAGPHVITPASALPQLTDDGIVIDGTTQPGASCGNLWGGVPHALKVQIDGGGASYALLIAVGDDVAIRGLSVTQGHYNFRVRPGADRARVTCSYLGLAPDGTPGGGSNTSIHVSGGDTVIGGLSAGEGNVIGAVTYGILGSNSATNLAIRGNFIGTDPTGMIARPNTQIGIGNGAGTTTINEIRGNLISGNRFGFSLQSDDTWTGVGGADFSIAGNYIGTDRTGNAPLPNTFEGMSFISGSLSGVVIGGTSPADRNVISGNGRDGIEIAGMTDITVLGNHIGIGADGTTVVANGTHGFQANGTTGLVIGNGAASGRNVVSGNGNFGIYMQGTSPSPAILGNFVGTDATGTLPRGNGNEGIRIRDAGTTGARIEDNVVADARDTADGTGLGIIVENGATATLLRNRVGVGADGTTPLGNQSSGVAALNGARIVLGDGTGANRNVIANNAFGLVAFGATSRAASTDTLFYNHSGEAIMIGATANDAGDGDAGANDLLNHPVLGSVTGTGTTDMPFDLTLDVPSHGAGYRIDFFRNTVFESHGEGEVHLGHVTVAHTGGDLRYAGTLSASAAVSIGDHVAATATRIVSGITYDITSEFSATVTATAGPDPMIVTSTADTDTVGTLRHAIGHANANPGDDAVTFAIPGAGPHTIVLTGDLPALTDPGISIDGTTQGGASCGQLSTGVPHTLKIHIDGQGATGEVLQTLGAATGVTLKGLSVTNAFGKGFFFRDGADNGRVECSYWGVEPDGTTAAPLVQSDGTSGATQVDRADGAVIHNNLFSGNADDANDAGLLLTTLSGPTITGNVFGLRADAAAPLPNANLGLGLYGVTGGTVGGTTPATRNVISGGTSAGLYIDPASSGIAVTGNHIGTDWSGAVDLGNGTHGVQVQGSTVTLSGNVVSGNGTVGIFLNGAPGTAILGNHIGVNAAGTAALGNTGNGVLVSNASSGTVIGDGTAAGRNVIGGNLSGRQILFTGAASSGFSIVGNHIGTDATGNVALVNGDGSGLEDAIQFGNVATSGLVMDNVIGGHADTGIEMFQGSSNTTIRGNSFDVGADGVSDISALATAGFQAGLFLRRSNANLTIGGTGAGQGNLFANGTGYGIRTGGTASDTVLVTGNTIRNNPLAGIFVQTGSVAITGNVIHSNGGLGIALDNTGVRANDAGDGDGGPNEGLNFPVIASIVADGTTAVDYAFTLDVPGHAQGYRIDFFANTAADPSGHGEGEVHLGHVDIVHGGGNPGFIGTLTANAGVSPGDIVSATATRATSGTTYDITSEFSVGIAATAAPQDGFVTTWNTALGDGGTTIELLANGGSDNYTVAWGDGTVTMNVSGDVSHVYASAGIYDIEITGDFAGFGFNNGGDVAKVTDIVQWGNVAFTNWGNGFYGAVNLTAYSATDSPDLSAGPSLSRMFQGTPFDGDVGNWDTSAIGDMRATFAFTPFNRDISGWETGNVTMMTEMFRGATAFDQNLDTVVAGGNGGGTAWDVSGVTNMSQMFRDASAFDRNLGTWTIGDVTTMQGMLDGTALSIASYDATLTGWAGQGVQAGVQLGASGLEFCMAATARASLIADDGWTITGDAACSSGALTVTSTADTDTFGTLRYAINHANANTGADAIGFAVPGAAGAVHVIALASELPLVTDAGVSIDGTTQGDAQCGDLWNGVPHALRIRIDGAGGAYSGPVLSGAGTAIRGLSVTNANIGITLGGAATGAVVQCSYVGLSPDGTAAGSALTGIRVNGANARVGGASAGQGNVVSANRWGILTHGGSTGTTVEGNFVGTDPTGTAPRGNTFVGLGHVSGAGTYAGIRRNLISGNGTEGILFDANDTVGGSAGTLAIAGNRIGTDRTGMAALPNGAGIAFVGVALSSGVTIGGATLADRNLISGNAGRAVMLDGTGTVTLTGNHIGIAADGTSPLPNVTDVAVFVTNGGTATLAGNVVSGNSTDGVLIYEGSSATFTGNFIGTDATGTRAIPNGDEGIVVEQGNAVATIGDGTMAGRNVIAGNGGSNVYTRNTGTATVTGNLIGIGTGGQAHGGAAGLHAGPSGTIVAAGNAIAHHSGAGIWSQTTGSRIAATVNAIHSNGGLGIELGADGVTANDAGDGDGGANEGLNYPVVDHFTVDGSSAVSYGVTLDVPGSANGYRVEFYTTDAPDATNGEGQTFLGSVDLAGPGAYAGSFTASVPVTVGRSIGATTTRRTGAGFDITSEFSVNATSRTANPAQIAASKVVAVIEDGLLDGDDTVAIPGATLRYTITIRNDGAGAADAGTTIVTDQIPPNGSLKVSDFGGMPGGGPLGVTQGSPSSGLTYSFLGLASGADDLEFSADGGATWGYAPADGGDGTDPGVTHIRIRPDGSFNANGGTPPSIDMRYEVVLF